MSRRAVQVPLAFLEDCLSPDGGLDDCVGCLMASPPHVLTTWGTRRFFWGGAEQRGSPGDRGRGRLGSLRGDPGSFRAQDSTLMSRDRRSSGDLWFQDIRVILKLWVAVEGKIHKPLRNLRDGPRADWPRFKIVWH